jgi:AcrR family transcriptional regulator
MAEPDWVLGADRRTAAAERIHAAATALVLARGWDALDIDTLAQQVHCSRATVYRYAGGKAQIRDAVLVRLSAGIVDAVRRAVDGVTGPDRVMTAITTALDQIRKNPLRRLMLQPTSPLPMAELHSSPLLRRIAADLSGVATDDPLAAQWIVRVVMSFAYWPVEDGAAEPQLLERFVAPAFRELSDHPSH